MISTLPTPINFKIISILFRQDYNGINLKIKMLFISSILYFMTVISEYTGLAKQSTFIIAF